MTTIPLPPVSRDSSRTQQRTARAAVLEGPQCLELRDIEKPRPGPGQVLIRLEGCGVCGSNLPVFEGRDWFTYPLSPGAPGHEGWGRVEAVGEGVTAFAEGDRVAAITQGAFATHDIADARHCVRIPDALQDQPFPGEPLACAMNAMERSGVRPGARVAIVGIGFQGALLVQLCARADAEVTALSRRDTSLDAARAMGASSLVRIGEFGATTEAARKHLDDDTDGFDVVIECAGAQPALDLASSLVRTRGCLVIVGFHQGATRVVDMQSWNWRGIDVINAHERDPAVYTHGLRRAAEAVASGALDPSPLYTHTFPLDRIGDAFDTALRRPEGFMKALVTM